MHKAMEIYNEVGFDVFVDDHVPVGVNEHIGGTGVEHLQMDTFKQQSNR